MKVIVVFVFTLLFISVEGQPAFKKKVHVGAGINLGVPVGIFSSVYSFTYGGNIKAELPTSQKFLLTLDIGYYEFLRKKGNETLAFIPVFGGFKYHFLPKVFIAAKAGISIPTSYDLGTVICFSPAVGYSISKKLEVSGNYTGFEIYGYVVGSAEIEWAYFF